MPTDQPRLLANRYQLLNRIGSGGMGVVWLAHDQLLNRDVAVKTTAGVLPDLQDRMEREAQVGARVSHPNVVMVYDLVDEADGPWLVMELVTSRSLAAVVADEGPLSPRRAAAIGRHVLAALAAVHAQGILHCDVKPSNVLIDEHGEAHLTDFGIAVDTGSRMTGTMMGAPAYLAPERARGLPMTAASDLWSLGATLYAAVEGRVPLERENALATIAAIATEEPEPARNAGPLWPVIDALLSSDPALRPSPTEADLMLRTVERRQDTTVVAPAPPVPTEVALEPVPEPAPRRRAAALVGVAAAVVGIAATLAFTASGGDTIKPGTRPAPPSAVAPVAEPTSASAAVTRDPAPVAYSSTAEPAATSDAPPSTVAPTTGAAPTTTVEEVPPTTEEPPTSGASAAPPSGP